MFSHKETIPSEVLISTILVAQRLDEEIRVEKSISDRGILIEAYIDMTKSQNIRQALMSLDTLQVNLAQNITEATRRERTRSRDIGEV